MSIYTMPITPVSSRYTYDWYQYLKNNQSVTGWHFIDLELKETKQGKNQFLPLDQYLKDVAYCEQSVKNLPKSDFDMFLHFDGLGRNYDTIDRFYEIEGFNSPTHLTLLHSGLWDVDDFLTKEPKPRNSALAQVHNLSRHNVIYILASDYHKDMILNYVRINMNKDMEEALNKRIKVIPFPVDVTSNYAGTLERNEYNIGFASRFCEEKGYFIINDMDKSGKLKPHNVSYALDNNLQTRQEYFSWLKKQDIIVLPNKQETYGMVFLEALMLAKVVIISQKDKPYKLYRELISKYENSYLGRVIEISDWRQLPDVLNNIGSKVNWANFIQEVKKLKEDLTCMKPF